MRRALQVVVLLMAITFLSACEGDDIVGGPKIGEPKYTVKISRKMNDNTSVPTLFILADEAQIRYGRRMVIAKGFRNISGINGENSWTVRNMSFDGGDLVIYLPGDATYNVWIGKQHHLISNVCKEEAEKSDKGGKTEKK